LETARKELSLKHTTLTGEVKRLKAENDVLETALKLVSILIGFYGNKIRLLILKFCLKSEGVGRKAQHNLQMLEKKLEIAGRKEKSAQETIEKQEKELEIDQKEKEELMRRVSFI
jgi:hypothetical protein